MHFLRFLARLAALGVFIRGTGPEFGPDWPLYQNGPGPFPSWSWFLFWLDLRRGPEARVRVASTRCGQTVRVEPASKEFAGGVIAAASRW